MEGGEDKQPKQRSGFYRENAIAIWVGVSAVALMLGYMVLDDLRHGRYPGGGLDQSAGQTSADASTGIFAPSDDGISQQVILDIGQMASATRFAFFTWGDACESPPLFTATDVAVNGKSCNGNMCDVDVSFNLMPTPEYFPWHDANPRCTMETRGTEMRSFSAGLSGRTGITSYEPGPVDRLAPGSKVSFHRVLTYQKFDNGWHYRSMRHP